MSNQVKSSNVQKIYNLEERIAKFGEAIIIFARSIFVDSINKVLINQVVCLGTSIGVNYKETLHWLRMLSKSDPKQKEKSQ